MLPIISTQSVSVQWRLHTFLFVFPSTSPPCRPPERARKADPKLEEQTIWNRWMTDAFTRVTVDVVDNIMDRKCITYEHTATKARVDMWPLNPNLFPNWPVYAKEKMPLHVLEPPFIMHANWIYGILSKVNTLKGAGMWYIDG